MRDANKRGVFRNRSLTNSPALRRGRSAIHAAQKADIVKCPISFQFERLETRQLLSGTWALVNAAVPSGDGGQNAVVLSDGSIMVHGGKDSASNAYYKLTPANGNYINGTWSTLTAAPTYRLFDATNVLTNGKVFVLGGEYSGSGTTSNFINTGEIYDPVANTWTVITNFPKTQYGDDPSEVLPNGNVLAGYISGPATYIYNPTANTWAATGTKMLSDDSDEETWVKLADDSILSYDVFASVSANVAHAQRYIPSTGKWIDAGLPPALLSTAAVGYELGPGLSLPDGRVFISGATNSTAYYNPSTNSWTAGPSFNVSGKAYVSADAPGAVLPNGDVLLALSPLGTSSGGGYSFPGPTIVVEMNPTTNAYSVVTPSLSGFSLASNAFLTTFTVLPTGQVAMFDASGRIAVYTESGSPLAGLAPTITNITNDAGTNTFTLTGNQLNGNSEGASYGDDNEDSSNYPLVRLTDQSGNITYARTFNWTLDGIANVSSAVSFTEPALGTYLVSVVANGVASAPVLSVQAGAGGNENFAVQPDTTPGNVDIRGGENGAIYSTFPISSFNSLIITGDAAANTLVINADLGGRSTIINGGNGNNDLDVENNGSGTVTETGASSSGATDYFDFSKYGQNLSSISNFTTVNGGAGNEQIRVFDSASTANTSYSIKNLSINSTGWAGLSYTGLTNGIALISGTGSDTVTVASTPSGVPVSVNSSGGSDVVNIGSNGSVQGILAPVTVANLLGLTTINVDDSLDSTAKTSVQIVASGSTSVLTGLAPVSITWFGVSNNTMNISGGSAGNNFTISSASPVNLNAGTGSDTINVNSTLPGSPVGLIGSTGNDTVNVGTAGLGNAAADFINSQQIGVLTIGDGGIAQVPASASRILLQAANILATGAGVLDLTSNDLIVSGSSLAAINALVQSGFNAGGTVWGGVGITSSTAAADTNGLTALGVIQNTYDGGADALYPTFDGASSSSTDVLVKFTYTGDANESGKVDGDDYSLIDSSFLAEQTSGNVSGWYNGDFNFDGVVNGSDYTLIDNSFNRQGASLAAEISGQVTASTLASKTVGMATLPTLDTTNSSNTPAGWQELEKKNRWMTQFFD